jgi:hypothetical protein
MADACCDYGPCDGDSALTEEQVAAHVRGLADLPCPAVAAACDSY